MTKRIMQPMASEIDAIITLPGSKYIANRLLPLCALAETGSIIHNVVLNDDIKTALCGLQSLGYKMNLLDEHNSQQLLVWPRINKCVSPVTVNTSHSGTFSRFITAIASLEEVAVSINCSEKMATRPMNELFSSLKQMGISISSQNNRLPAVVTGLSIAELAKAKDQCPLTCKLDASRSSQYLSALLIIAPKIKQGLSIELTDHIVSRAYVDMTIQLMSEMGVSVVETQSQNGLPVFTVKSAQSYQGNEFTIACDPVSATYFMAAVAIRGGRLIIEQFDFDSLQGEYKFYHVVEKMGVKVNADVSAKRLKLVSDGQLNAVNVDMSQMPDAVQTFAVMAAFAKGKSRVSNIAHLAFKESNRIIDTATELSKAGIKVETSQDSMSIEGGTPQPCTLETHDDHRMAMSLALLGIKALDKNSQSIVIKDADVVAKSFPDYWQYLAKIGFNSELCES
jgi:3-phosphoshikimate 1-carboxyvinyltransferase